MKKNHKINAGYTLIETMIAISLFLIVVMAGMGALLNANLLHQKTQNLRAIMDNLSFVMEDMSRNLRIGYNFHCITASDDLSNVTTPLSCSTGVGVAFESALGSTASATDQWVYKIQGGKIFKATQGPYTVATNFIQITPDEIVIDPVSSISVLGAEPIATDSQQPFVSIRLVGKILYKNADTPFSLQTSVSQRLIDI